MGGTGGARPAGGHVIQASDDEDEDEESGSSGDEDGQADLNTEGFVVIFILYAAILISLHTFIFSTNPSFFIQMLCQFSNKTDAENS